MNRGRPRKWPKTPGVYFAACGDEVKIGCSTRMNVRLSGINSAAGGDGIELLGVIELDLEIDDLKACEAAVHRFFARKRIRGEWFELDDEVRAVIENLCAAPAYIAGGVSADHPHDATFIVVP